MDTTRRDRTPMNRWTGENQRPLSVCMARIAAVRELGGIPIGAYDVVFDNGQQETNVPMLLPASSHLFRSGKREHGASGLVPIASVGDNCLVIYVGHQMGLAQPFILGFFAPRREGQGGDYPNPRRVRPGSMVLATPYGNGIVLRNGGIIEIESEPHVKRVMTPAAAGATDVTASMIADRCRNYRLLTASGEMRFGEAGGGKSNMKFRVSEFSSFKLTRQLSAAAGGAAAVAQGDVVGAAAAAAELLLPRFVEVVWGAAGGNDLAKETYFGPEGQVVITQDGAGGMKTEADQSIELAVLGGIVSVKASFDGSLESQSLTTSHTVVGTVTYDVGGIFTVNAALIALNGIVVILGGGLPSARMTDLVLVGDRVGEVITGQPNLIH